MHLCVIDNYVCLRLRCLANGAQPAAELAWPIIVGLYDKPFQASSCLSRFSASHLLAIALPLSLRYQLWSPAQMIANDARPWLVLVEPTTMTQPRWMSPLFVCHQHLSGAKAELPTWSRRCGAP